MNLRSPLQSLESSLFREKNLKVFVKRDDLLHPYVMGNKWRKLKYNLEVALQSKAKGILTFGGAFSNHLAATAAACHEVGLKSIGIVRGEELNLSSNPTLRFAHAQGMQLNFVSREAYRQIKSQTTIDQYPEYTVLPEGGTNHLAIKGCKEIIEEIDVLFDYVLVPVGTGGTMAGLLQGMEEKGELLGFSSLKGDFIKKEFMQLLQKDNIHFSNFTIDTSFHFGGYGKVTTDLVTFINYIKQKFKLPLDPIYTGKMFYGFLELVRRDYFKPGSSIVLVHTGGLQGIVGYNELHDQKIMT